MARRYGLASQRLTRLAERWTNDGEVPCHRATASSYGKPDLCHGCLVLWSWPRSGIPARLCLAAIELIKTGRYSPAEEQLLTALTDPSPAVRRDSERELIRLYRYQGRFHDVRPLIRASWCRARQPALVLKELWGFDLAPKPVDLLKSSLRAADQDDDRVWLGWANHAILIGQFDEARSWLERCLSRRPDDLAVWQAQLDLALATGDVGGFWTAAPHLPAARFDLAEVLAYGAWLAASNHDPEREERVLSSLIGCDPGDAKALERLAVLNAEAGRHREAEVLHRGGARSKPGPRKVPPNPPGWRGRAEPEPQVMAELSAKLGRTFDAQAWSILAEAGLGARGGDPPGSTPEGSSLLPDSLVDQATALSAAYGIVAERLTRAGPTLGERLADLRPASVARQAKTTRAGVVRSEAESKKVVADFVDDAQAAGLRFQLESGHTAQHLLPETMSGGVGLIDFDGDGWLDVYCVQGGALADAPGGQGTAPPAAGDRLFRNQGNGTFEDVTEKTGIARIAWGRGYGHGVAVGDYDNDGQPDLFVSRLMTYSLYRNRGDGSFEDVTQSAGLAGRRDHPTSAAWADLDNDGDLDLYVCHYMIWDPAHPPICQDMEGRIYYCHPLKVSPAPDHVFRNGGGRFVDVTAVSGCAETEGRGLGVIAADLDGDHRIDLFVANDSTVNYLYRNQGGFHFEETAIQAGVEAPASRVDTRPAWASRVVILMATADPT